MKKDSNPPKNPDVTSAKTYIVGVGASAGGLEAITQVIGRLRPDIPAAYIVLQHLSPTYRSMMVEILARETPLAVREASQGDVPQRGTIYVVPANNNAIIKEGRLQLVTAAPEIVPKPSINQFLISLAAEEGEAAIGIILSGTGSDGVAGLRAIQAAGGVTVAQRPDTAKYDGMPRSAIDSGVVDHVLSPHEIAGRMPEFISMLPGNGNGNDLDPPIDLLDKLLTLVRQHLKFDFSGYKMGTLTRRVRRREIATGKHDLAEYIRWVEQNPAELELLSRDILISVTAFFRDRDAFDVLRKMVGDLCDRKPPGSEIRVWVAGCASGEEAYSIAILFADALGEQLSQYRVQIFATDLDDDALNIARRGVYPAGALAELPAEQLEQHFKQINHAYEVGKHLRDMIVFARHNLVSDPPFLRLDLVSCRNVMIYFDAPLQSKVLHTFHFGLVNDGHLFLGRSESVAQAEQLFMPVDRRERLFRKTGDHQPTLHPIVGRSPLASPVQRRERRMEQILGAIVEHFGVTALLCDSDGVIQHSSGRVDSFLEFPMGTARLAVGDVTVSSLRGELLSLMHHCRSSGKAQRGRCRKLNRNYLRIIVEPVPDHGSNAILVLFVPEKGPTREVEEVLDPVIQSGVEDELVATREHLQTMIEEMATANEEMQALNEEAQAANEELQATNEELEAANEELQATNEELVSLNEELSVKTSELARLSEEYAHLYDALQFPLLVFDRSNQLIRFNGPAQRRFELRPTAIRQHVSQLKLGPAMMALERLLGHALAHADREDLTVEQDGRTFRLSVVPGFTQIGDVVSLVVTLIDISDVTVAHAQLAESQSRLSSLMANTQVLFCMKDLRGAYLFANRRYTDFFGLTDKDFIGRSDFQLFSSEMAASLWDLDISALRQRLPVKGDLRLETGEGRRYLATTHLVLDGADGEPSVLVTEAEDVTTARLAEEQLRITGRVFDQAGEAIAVTNSRGVIETVNQAFTRMTGYSALEAVGRTPGELLKSGQHSAEFYRQMWQQLIDQGYWQGEIWNKRKNGELYPEWLTINRVDDDGGRGEHYVAIFSDITQIKNAQRRVEYLATHDQLTGLANRVLFQDRLRHALAQARRGKSRLAVLFIDLDNFKTINDTLGHDVGDELLKQVGVRLQEVVRDVDTIARQGGDEFTAILSDCSLQVVEQVAQRVIDDLGASFIVDRQVLCISASIGVAFYPEDGSDSGSLVKAADVAMYRAKELGRNRVEFFKPELQVRLHRRVAVEGALREALRVPGRLRLVLQPKYGLTQDRPLLGAEALLRWNDPELGEVSPSDFIPVAENSGLIQELGKQVLAMLVARISEWQRMGLALPTIAFNVSPRCIREAGFAEGLLQCLQVAGVAASCLQIEITEGALLENSVTVSQNLELLAEAGMTASVDDFGTGYSSLSYLKRLRLSELKIDRSFVAGLGEDRDDEAIALAVIGMARALRLRTVAEGVETAAQLDWLTGHECDLAQGFLLARPMELDAFEDILVGRAR